MPFKSEKQRRYLWMNDPKLAKKWTNKYGSTSLQKVAQERLKKKNETKHGS